MRPIASLHTALQPKNFRKANELRPRQPPREKLTIATVNDDFTDKKSRLKRLDKVTDVMLVQEAKRTHIRKLLDEKSGVHQDRSSEDRAGSAVVWDRKDARAVDRGLTFASGKDHGVLNRWITWTDLKVGDEKVRMVSVHRPPGYASALWPAFDRNLKKFIAQTKREKLPIVIGMDANTEKYGRFAKLAGLRWHAPKGPTAHGKTIDGFLASKGIRFDNLRRLDRGPSDHTPVVADIRLPR